MDNNVTPFSFWKFLKGQKIEIPIIQRDYAQGRTGKEYLRNSFLNNLKQALDGNLPEGENVLKLDFVYGSVEDEKLQPLDGQQRLTTLWLMHWYIALQALKGRDDNQLKEVFDVLKRFTYETRISSREFCEQLCQPSNFDQYECGNNIVPYLKTRTCSILYGNKTPRYRLCL